MTARTPIAGDRTAYTKLVEIDKMEVTRRESRARLAALNIEDNGEAEFEAEELFILECIKKKKDLSRQINQITEKQQERHERLSEIEELFGGAIEALKEQIRQAESIKDSKNEELRNILHPPPKEPLPPGPANLRFVTGDYFGLVATIVIIANIAMMVIEMVDPSKKDDFFWPNQFYMAFYIMELVLKARLLHCTMLFGPVHIVWWNWLDTVIVVTGCVDMYIFPMLQFVGAIDGGVEGLKMLSFLRTLRLLRILKIVGMFLKADTSWSNGDQFQMFIMGVIAFNSVVMGLEIEVPRWNGWYVVEQSLLVIFTFELACRLKHFGCQFFVHETDLAWNWLDFVIVMGGIVDQWMMPAVALVQKLMGHPSSGSGKMGEVMMLLRMARLLRILRLVRLVKSVPPLFTLIVGIAEAMQGMMWVIVLTIVILYACSLICVKLIGKGMVAGGNLPAPVEAIFPNVFDSFFVLFKAMNGDWGALEPLFEEMPISKFILFLYTIVSTWGILSILTAVVSENMINATEGQRNLVEKEEEEKEAQKKEDTLSELFDELDLTKNGELSHNEYQHMLDSDETKLKLLEVSGLQTDEELKKLFHYLGEPPSKVKHKGAVVEAQRDDEAVLHKKTFVEALKHNSREVSERSVMRLEDRIHRLESEMRQWAREVLPNHAGLHEHIVAFLEYRDKDDEQHSDEEERPQDEEDKAEEEELSWRSLKSSPTDPTNGVGQAPPGSLRTAASGSAGAASLAASSNSRAPLLSYTGPQPSGVDTKIIRNLLR